MAKGLLRRISRRVLFMAMLIVGSCSGFRFLSIPFGMPDRDCKTYANAFMADIGR